MKTSDPGSWAERPVRWVADAPLAALAAVALATLGLMSWLALRFPPVFDPLVACATLTATWMARGTAAATLLPAFVATLGLAAAAIAVTHQIGITNRVVRRLVASRRPVPMALRQQVDDLGLSGRIDYLDIDEPFAFCHGFARPRVCVTRGLVHRLDSRELAAVLRHEAHHARHRDPLKILVSRALASGVFFLPLAARLRDGYLAGKELTADLEAAGTDRLPLARALLKLLDATPTWPSGVVAVSALSATDARVAWLLEPSPIRPLLPSPREWLRSLVVVVALVFTSHTALAAGTTAALHAACDPALEESHVTGAAVVGQLGGREAIAPDVNDVADQELVHDAAADDVSAGDECTLLLRPCLPPSAGSWPTSLCSQGLLSGCGLLQLSVSPSP